MCDFWTYSVNLGVLIRKGGAHTHVWKPYTLFSDIRGEQRSKYLGFKWIYHTSYNNIG